MEVFMKKTFFSAIIAAVLTFAAYPVVAANIDFSSAITQDDFNKLTKEAGSALGYRNMAPAAALGITGFDVGAEFTAVSIDKSSRYWNSAFGNDAPSYLVIPKIRVRKGLPFGIDVGAMYSYIPDSNVKLYGAELSKAIIDGGMAAPAVGIRATYTKLAGVDDLGLQTYGIDASISKGFLFITPYAGAGIMRINSQANGYLHTLGLKDESVTEPRVFGGVKISPVPFLAITAEAEYAVRPIYSLKGAISF